MHGIMGGDEQTRVHKLQQQEGGNDIKPAGALAAAVWGVCQPDLPAAVVKQHHPGCDEAAGDGNTLGIVAGGPGQQCKCRQDSKGSMLSITCIV